MRETVQVPRSGVAAAVGVEGADDGGADTIAAGAAGRVAAPAGVTATPHTRSTVPMRPAMLERTRLDMLNPRGCAGPM